MVKFAVRLNRRPSSMRITAATLPSGTGPETLHARLFVRSPNLSKVDPPFVSTLTTGRIVFSSTNLT